MPTSTAHGARESKRSAAQPDRLGSIDAQSPTQQVDRAVAAARQAQPAWADTDANTRCAVLRALAAELNRRHDELIALTIRETGGTAEKAEEELGQSINQLLNSATQRHSRFWPCSPLRSRQHLR
jgi:acyl-CoA reductase-like NAD-dependent aldehyde dehydrogenase